MPYNTPTSSIGSSIGSTPQKSPLDDPLLVHQRRKELQAEKIRQSHTEWMWDPPISPPPTKNRPRLTFGIEIEFCIAYLLPSGTIYRHSFPNENLPHTPNPDPEDPRPVRGIATTEPELEPVDGSGKRVFAFNANQAKEAQREEIYKHIITTLEKAGLPIRQRYSKGQRAEDWTLISDASVSPMEIDDESAGNYNFMDVELVSLAFYYTKESLEQVKRVCEILSNTYRIVGEKNPSCGLHVHLSSRRPHDEFVKDSERSGHAPCYHGFHPRNLTNLCAVLRVFERAIEHIHPVHRRSGHRWAEYCESLWKGSMLASLCQPATNPDGRREGLKSLLSLRGDTNCKDTCLLTQNLLWERLSYNTTPLKNPEGKRTVEFRGHEATLDAEEIVRWINVCTGLVEFADTVKEEALDEFLWSHIDKNIEDYTVIDLLKAIGCPDEAEYYDKKIRERENAEAKERDLDPSEAITTPPRPQQAPSEIRFNFYSLGAGANNGNEGLHRLLLQVDKDLETSEPDLDLSGFKLDDDDNDDD